MEPPSCKNIRSQRLPDQRCPNPAVHGEYCGLHFKHPRPFKSRAKMSIDETPINSIVIPMDSDLQIKKLQKWWRFRGRLRSFYRQGPAKWQRDICTNSTDFYSMEDICTLSGEYVFSFVGGGKCVYAFDLRSLSMLLEKNEQPQNPYTREVLSEKIVTKAKNLIRWSRKKGIDTRWAAIEPQSPDQRFKLKVTDLFQKIDELNYYTNPEWFLGLTVDDLRCFYVELYDIWFHRAELSNEMRKTIIPAPAHPFKYPINEIVAQRNLDFLRKVNMDIIRMFVSAAVERTDRILGAMYIVTVMTLVNRQCRQMYPWLYESATPGIYGRYRAFTNPGPTHMLNALNNLLAGDFNLPNIFMQPLLLGPPAGAGTIQAVPNFIPLGNALILHEEIQGLGLGHGHGLQQEEAQPGESQGQGQEQEQDQD
jgi:hypothetical protein